MPLDLKILREEIEVLDQFFKLVDEQGKGFVTGAELFAVARTANPNLLLEDFVSLYYSKLRQARGPISALEFLAAPISFEQFAAYFVSTSRNAGAQELLERIEFMETTIWKKRKLFELFALLDADKDGKLSKAEFAAACFEFNPSLLARVWADELAAAAAAGGAGGGGREDDLNGGGGNLFEKAFAAMTSAAVAHGGSATHVDKHQFAAFLFKFVEGDDDAAFLKKLANIKARAAVYAVTATTPVFPRPFWPELRALWLLFDDKQQGAGAPGVGSAISLFLRLSLLFIPTWSLFVGVCVCSRVGALFIQTTRPPARAWVGLGRADM